MKNEKVVFIDMDGTVADIEFHTHPTDDYEKGFFLNKKPCKTIIDSINELFKDYHKIILSASPNDEFDQEKLEWLKKYFPELGPTDMVFIRWPNDDKVAMLKKVCLFKNIDPKNVLLIDDNLDILRKSNSNGITAIHPVHVLIMKEELENEYQRSNQGECS